MFPRLHTIHRPDSAARAVRILKKGNGNAAVLAGGSSLVLSGRKNLTELVDLSGAGLDRIEVKGKRLHLGAMVRAYDLARSETALLHGGTALVQAASCIGSTLTRNLVTVGGNVCQLLPWCHLPVVLSILDASMHLTGAGVRRVDVETFLAGPPRKILGKAGVVTGVSLPVRKDRRSAFGRFSRTKTDRALVTVAVAFRVGGGRLTDVRTAAGACTPKPQRIAEAESLLEGERPAPATFEGLEKLSFDGVNFASDMRASEEYKRRILGVLLARASQGAFGAGGPDR
jgi:carbon-monoxide dehydrogenase medium subunit